VRRLRALAWTVLALGSFFLVYELLGEYVIIYWPCLHWPLIWRS
jgi:hypothetical protein